ncbi:MAG: hypothetical protein ACKOCK_00195, partial [Chloroflexota bacterium]
YAVSSTINWTSASDGTIDSDSPKIAAIRVGTPEEVEASPMDPLVAERTAIQRAAVARREALEHQRAGRYAASGQAMDMARYRLSMAPDSDEIFSERVMYDRMGTLASQPMDSAELKAAYQLDAEARRGRSASKSRGPRRDPNAKPNDKQQ